MGKVLDTTQALALVKQHVVEKYGSVYAAAAAFGIDKAFLYTMFSGKRAVPQWLPDEVGLTRKRRIVYEYEVRT